MLHCINVHSTISPVSGHEACFFLFGIPLERTKRPVDMLLVICLHYPQHLAPLQGALRFSHRGHCSMTSLTVNDRSGGDKGKLPHGLRID